MKFDEPQRAPGGSIVNWFALSTSRCRLTHLASTAMDALSFSALLCASRTLASVATFSMLIGSAFIPASRRATRPVAFLQETKARAEGAQACGARTACLPSALAACVCASHHVFSRCCLSRELSGTCWSFGAAKGDDQVAGAASCAALLLSS